MNNQLKQNKPFLSPQQKGELFAYSVFGALIGAFVLLNLVFYVGG